MKDIWWWRLAALSAQGPLIWLIQKGIDRYVCPRWARALRWRYLGYCRRMRAAGWRRTALPRDSYYTPGLMRSDRLLWWQQQHHMPHFLEIPVSGKLLRATLSFMEPGYWSELTAALPYRGSEIYQGERVLWREDTRGYWWLRHPDPAVRSELLCDWLDAGMRAYWEIDSEAAAHDLHRTGLLTAAVMRAQMAQWEAELALKLLAAPA